jgi:GNAT superfamily N-acetyltransferase
VALRIVPWAERPELDERWGEITRSAWPEFMHHDEVCNAHWESLFDRYGELQLLLLDGDEVAGVANAIPLRWDGSVEDLPGGVDGLLLRAQDERRRGLPPTAVSALLAVVSPESRGRGLSRMLLEGMRAAGAAQGLRPLLAPVRPTSKARYPLTPMERYCRWRREDGLLFDPWLRVHERPGAHVVGVAESSMRVRGSVTDWEGWAGMPFPESGDYVVPGALVPVRIDRERDEGLYVEPNVWMVHPE